MKFWKGKKAIDGDIDAVLNFTGKSGKEWKLLIKDDQVARLIEESGKIGGKEKTQDLFRYLDDNGNDSGIKLLSHLPGTPLDDVPIDAPVMVEFEVTQGTGQKVPEFRVVS